MPLKFHAHMLLCDYHMISTHDYGDITATHSCHCVLSGRHTVCACVRGVYRFGVCKLCQWIESLCISDVRALAVRICIWDIPMGLIRCDQNLVVPVRYSHRPRLFTGRPKKLVWPRRFSKPLPG